LGAGVGFTGWYCAGADSRKARNAPKLTSTLGFSGTRLRAIAIGALAAHTNPHTPQSSTMRVVFSEKAVKWGMVRRACF